MYILCQYQIPEDMVLEGGPKDETGDDLPRISTPDTKASSSLSEAWSTPERSDLGHDDTTCSVNNTTSIIGKTSSLLPSCATEHDREQKSSPRTIHLEQYQHGRSRREQGDPEVAVHQMEAKRQERERVKQNIMLRCNALGQPVPTGKVAIKGGRDSRCDRNTIGPGDKKNDEYNEKNCYDDTKSSSRRSLGEIILIALLILSGAVLITMGILFSVAQNSDSDAGGGIRGKAQSPTEPPLPLPHHNSSDISDAPTIMNSPVMTSPPALVTSPPALSSPTAPTAAPTREPTIETVGGPTGGGSNTGTPTYTQSSAPTSAPLTSAVLLLPDARHAVVELGGDLQGAVVRYAINSDQIAVMITVPAIAWVGFGFPDADGTATMTSRYAAIGLPAQGTVNKHFLGGKRTSLITLAADSQQTLSNTSLYQDQMASTTTMEFIKFLNEDGEPPIDPTGPNTFVAAWGYGNTLQYHQGYGSFVLDLGQITCNVPRVESLEHMTVFW